MIMGTTGEPTLGRTLRDDIRRGDFGRTVRRDFEDLKEFMLDEQRKKRLVDMSRLKGWFYIAAWLLKSMFLKLTPARRLLLVGGFILVMASHSVVYSDDNVQIQSDTNVAGILCVTFVLMLELKDKLVAKSELEAGKAVQKALMPEPSPSVPGWDLWLFTRSANEVGGDLVDFVRLDDTRCGVALGDVAGKGLSAALLTAKLQATLRALVTDQTSVAGLGKKLNAIFYRDSPRSTFASLVYVELQGGSMVLRLINAGHIPPLIIRRGGLEKMEKGGTALGLASDAEFVEHRVELGSGDILLAYSDGLTEAQNEAAEFFGEQRLISLLPGLTVHSARELGQGLVEEVDRFIGQARPHDDLSIAVLKRL
jgi:phosphoserine phosphatase RsbU/P